MGWEVLHWKTEKAIWFQLSKNIICNWILKNKQHWHLICHKAECSISAGCWPNIKTKVTFIYLFFLTLRENNVIYYLVDNLCLLYPSDLLTTALYSADNHRKRLQLLHNRKQGLAFIEGKHWDKEDSEKWDTQNRPSAKLCAPQRSRIPKIISREEYPTHIQYKQQSSPNHNNLKHLNCQVLWNYISLHQCFSVLVLKHPVLQVLDVSLHLNQGHILNRAGSAQHAASAVCAVVLFYMDLLTACP